jgi:hypothetical protein
MGSGIAGLVAGAMLARCDKPAIARESHTIVKI